MPVTGDLILTVNGISRADKVDKLTTEVFRKLTEYTATASFRVFGFTPVMNEPVTIDEYPTPIFAGTISKVTQSIVGSQVFWLVDCIDWSRLLSKELVTGQYMNTAAHLIVLDLVNTFSTGFTTVNIASTSPTITEIVFSDEPLGLAIQRIAQQVGFRWLVDPLKDIHFDVNELTLPAPTPLNLTNVKYERLVYSLETFQRVTRAIVVGGGAVLVLDWARVHEHRRQSGELVQPGRRIREGRRPHHQLRQRVDARRLRDPGRHPCQRAGQRARLDHGRDDAERLRHRE